MKRPLGENAKSSNVGHDLSTLVGEVLFDQVHEFLGDGGTSNLVGRGSGSKSKFGTGIFIISITLGSTFFRGSNVDLVKLESTGLALKKGKEPGGRTDTGGLKEKGGLEEDVNNRVGEEGNREASGNQLPGNGSKDGGGDGSHESQVEEQLDTVRDTEDVGLVTNINVDGGDTGNNEEAKGDSHLTTAHESRKILSTVLEKALASLEGNGGGSTFRLGDLGDSKESNLHTLEKTNTAHEDKEEDEGDSVGDSIPGRGLSTVEGFNGDSKGKSKNSHGEKDTSPEEGKGESSLRRFV